MLAAHLGGVTVTELKERMTYREFQRWVWYLAENPAGDVAMDMRFIDLIAFLANTKRKKGKRPIPMIYFTDKRKKRRSAIKQTAEEAGAMLRGLAGKFSKKTE